MKIYSSVNDSNNSIFIFNKRQTNNIMRNKDDFKKLMSVKIQNWYNPWKNYNNNFILNNINNKILKQKNINIELIKFFIKSIDNYYQMIHNNIFKTIEEKLYTIFNNFNENESFERSYFDFNDEDCGDDANIIDIYESLKKYFNNNLEIEIKLTVETFKFVFLTQISKYMTSYCGDIRIILNLSSIIDFNNLKELYYFEEETYQKYNKNLLNLYDTWIKDEKYFKSNFEKKFTLFKVINLKTVKVDLLNKDKRIIFLTNGKKFINSKIKNYNKIIYKQNKIIRLQNLLHNLKIN